MHLPTARLRQLVPLSLLRASSCVASPARALQPDNLFFGRMATRGFSLYFLTFLWCEGVACPADQRERSCDLAGTTAHCRSGPLDGRNPPMSTARNARERPARPGQPGTFPCWPLVPPNGRSCAA